MLTANNTSKTAKIIKGDINYHHIAKMSMCCQVISPFMIFAVFGVLLAVNMCIINYSFYIYICSFITPENLKI